MVGTGILTAPKPRQPAVSQEVLDRLAAVESGKSDVGHKHPASDITDLDLSGIEIDTSNLATKDHNHDGVYSKIGHTHTGVYSEVGHTHTGVYQPAGNYASATHTHDAYAAKEHTHTQYQPKGDYQPAGSYAASDHTHTEYQPKGNYQPAGSYQPAGDYASATHNHAGVYSEVGHTHSNYSLSTHDHAGVYAPIVHDHDSSYAAKEHDHAGVYSETGHTHSNYALSTHDHAGVYAAVSHTHPQAAVEGLAAALAGKAASDHNHDDVYQPKGSYQPAGSYALEDHNHDDSYAAKSHNHDDAYAAKDHDHADVYQPKGDYAASVHSHTEYQPKGSYAYESHTHDVFDVDGLSESLNDKAPAIHSHPLASSGTLVTELIGVAKAKDSTIQPGYYGSNSTYQVGVVSVASSTQHWSTSGSSGIEVYFYFREPTGVKNVVICLGGQYGNPAKVVVSAGETYDKLALVAEIPLEAADGNRHVYSIGKYASAMFWKFQIAHSNWINLLSITPTGEPVDGFVSGNVVAHLEGLDTGTFSVPVSTTNVHLRSLPKSTSPYGVVSVGTDVGVSGLTYTTVDDLKALVGGGGTGASTIAGVEGLQAALDAKSDTGHTHTEYQPKGDYQPAGSYALSSHNHDDVYQPKGSYATSTHDHAGVYQPVGSYASSDHNHDDAYQPKGDYQPAGSYASSDHRHDDVYQPKGDYQPAGSYAQAVHTHSASDVDGLTAFESGVNEFKAGATGENVFTYVKDGKLATSDVLTFSIDEESSGPELLGGQYLPALYVANSSDTGQTLSTDVTFDQDDEIEFKWEVMANTSSNWRIPIGSSYPPKNGMVVSAADTDHHYWGGATVTNVPIGRYANSGALGFVWKTTMRRGYICDENLTTGAKYEYTFNSSATFTDVIKLFGGEYSRPFIGRIYYVKINGGVKADLVPIDGGMLYDKVGGVAYGGTRIVSVMPDAVESNTWLKFNGVKVLTAANVYTRDDADARYAKASDLSAKQNVISDLTTIRANASKGATALQSVPTTYALKTDVPDLVDLSGKADVNHTHTEYQPKGDYQPAGNYVKATDESYTSLATRIAALETNYADAVAALDEVIG